MMHLLAFAVVTGLALVVTLLVGRDAWFNADANLRLAEIDDGRSRSAQGDRAAARRDVQVRRAELRLFAAARTAMKSRSSPGPVLGPLGRGPIRCIRRSPGSRRGQGPQVT